MQRWQCLYAVVFFALVVNLSAQTDSMKNKSAQQGKAKFLQSCAMCHGAEAMGGIGPNLIQSSLTRHDENGNLIASVIQEGRMDKGMPAFPTMSSADITDIVSFIHASIDNAGRTSSQGLGGGYALKQLLTGNSEGGKRYFYGAGGCIRCHSPTGDLAGIANKYSPFDLEVRFLYPRHDNATATVMFPSGEKFQGKLLHLDAFYVAIQNQDDGWYRSWPLREVRVEVNDPLAGHLELLGKYTDKDIHDVFAYLETLK